MKSISYPGRSFIIIFLFILSAGKVLAAQVDNYSMQSGIDLNSINNKINVLKLHKIRYGTTPDFSNFKYSFKILTETEYQTQKPSSALPFDVGFIDADGMISVSEPVTTSQKAVFSDINKAALYYLCQSYIQFYYQTTSMPLWLKVGFAAFEAHLDPPDATIKTALNAYGGSISSFSVLNDLNTFNANNGFAVAYAFGEYMNIYKEWGYPNTYIVDANTINVDAWWWNVYTLDRLLKVWNNYMKARFLEPNESLRVKLYLETEHFKFYTREADSKNFPAFNNVLEPAYNEYVTNFGVTASEKLTFFTLPECGIGADIEELPCGNRITGGTAWSSGLHSTCAATDDQIPLFVHQNRHELAHVFQGLLPQGSVTAWLNEGFAHFCALGPIVNERMTEWRQYAIDGIKAGTTYFGHLPTYEDTKIYPSPDYGYYTLGYFLNDFIYRKGGYAAVKDVQLGDLAGYQKMGYASRQAFLDDFYFDFDVRVQQMPVVTLQNPIKERDELNSAVNVSWTPLKSDVKLNVSVSIDEGTTWTEIVNRTTATSCTWNAGDISKRFFLKFTAPDNLNVSTTYGPFIKGNLNSLNIVSPVLNNYAISCDTLAIKWSTTAIQQVKLEYSLNNGSSWTSINSSVSGPLRGYKWIIPANLSGDCRLKITDINNGSVSSTSEIFKIVKNDEIGGPYLLDKNTILLLHFDNDLNNRSYLAPNGTGNLQNLTGEASTVLNLGNSYKTTSLLSVPHHANLNMTGDWTIEAWVKLNSYNTNNNMYLFWKPGNIDPYQSNYSLEVNPWWGNVFYGYYFSGIDNRIGLTGASPMLNEWYHVAFIRDTKNKRLQVIVHDKNRKLISTREMSYSPSESYLNSKDLLIGSNLDGYIDEVRISNIVRTFVITGVEKVKQGRVFSIYPNPSSGIVKIKMDDSVNGGKISVINATGQTILEKETGIGEIIDLSGLSKGLYLIRITTKNVIQTERLILK
jgi:hypothetical protein